MTDDLSSGMRDNDDVAYGGVAYPCPVPHVHEYWSDQFSSQ